LKKSTTIFWFLSSFVFSEDFKHVSIENISSIRALSATQDSSGFVWIGTDEGLNRYDGYLNKIYRSNIFDDKTISGNRIWIVHTDQQNTVWVGTDRGVCYYNKEKDDFTRIETGSRPVHVVEHGSYVFFTTTNDGVYRISKQTKEVVRYLFDPLDPFSLSSSKFSEIQKKPIAISGDVLWIGTTNGLNKTNMKTGQTKRLYSGKTDLVKSDTVTSVVVVNDILYVGTTEGLGVSDLAFGADLNRERGRANNSYIANVFKINNAGAVGVALVNEILILEEGLLTQRVKTNKPLNEVTKLTREQFLITSTTHTEGLFLTIGEDGKIFHDKIETPLIAKSIFVDKEDGVWMAGDAGLMRAGNTKSPITKELDIIIKPGQFSKTEKELFFLGKNGVFSYRGINKNPTLIYKTKKRKKDNRKIYISNNKEVYLYDKKLEKINKDGELDVLVSFLLPINNVLSTESSVFISLKNSGIAHYNSKTKTLTDYRKNRLLSKLLPPGASSFHIDKDTLWVGSDERGLYQVNVVAPEQPKVIKHHTYEKSNERSFSSSSVSCMTQHSNNLIVGTNGDGVFIYDKKGFDRITIEHGLPSNNIVSLSSSSDSTLWVLTNGGLALIDWSEKNISVISQDEGLTTFYKDKNATISSVDGNVRVVSPDGLYKVNKNQLYTNEYEAMVVIESVQLIDKNNKKHNTVKTNIKATHTKPTIKINLTAPAIYKAEKTTFSYFIEGYHSAWVDNGDRRYVELQGLDPGTYTIKIKSYNSDGYESKNIATASFQVVPPWWETWWAYLLYASTTLALFAYYVAYQKRAQAKATEDKRKEEELEEARQFQLDMLPRETPDDLGLDISAAIETASEVGGDYYDYFPQKDKQSLYVVVGDATGHGMTAGMMVSITKAGLYGIPSIPPNDIAKRLNRVIKNIDLGWNRMAFNMARFWENKVEFTSAAMPPVYHYHSSTGEVDEVLLGGLPLGSIKDETFALEEFDFNIGDSLVFISDGLPEAENSQGEMLGYEAVFNCVKANGKESAEEQKQALLDLGSAWLGELRNQDDITIVVVKKSNPLD